MSRNGSGTYTLPAGNPVVTGTTIETSWANTTLSDIATALTDSLSRSGQGGMTASFRGADGTSGLPGISFTNETTTGLYRAGSADLRLAITTNQIQQWLTTGTSVTGTLSATGNISFDGGSFTFNESGADKDARFEGDTDANLLFTDASTDRVGVGTNVPATKFTVRGAVQSKEVALRWERATDGAVAGGLGYFYDSENSLAIGSVTNHPVKLIVNDATAATLDTSGNLGVGTIVPTFGTGSGVEIQRAGVATLRLDNTSDSNSFEMYADSAANGINLRGRDSSPMLFWTGNSERFRIGSSGQLGIGGANYGTSGQVLTSQGSGSPPQWTNAAAGDVTLNGTQTLTNKTLVGVVLNDGYVEEVFAVSGTTPALSPTNGSIQTWTLSANSTPTAGTWSDGASMTLMIDDGTAYTVTWTSLSVTWKTNSGSAPALNTSGYTVISLWKVGGTIYGARVGNA